jgi:hypothetical protein
VPISELTRTSSRKVLRDRGLSRRPRREACCTFRNAGLTLPHAPLAAHLNVAGMVAIVVIAAVASPSSSHSRIGDCKSALVCEQLQSGRSTSRSRCDTCARRGEESPDEEIQREVTNGGGVKSIARAGTNLFPNPGAVMRSPAPSTSVPAVGSLSVLRKQLCQSCHALAGDDYVFTALARLHCWYHGAIPRSGR